MIVLYSKITGIHGIKGGIEISLYNKEYFNSLPLLNRDTPVIIDSCDYIILNVKKKNRSIIFYLKDVDSVDKANELVGKCIFIDTLYLPTLDKDTFYRSELIGCKVIDNGNNVIGEIVDVYTIPSNAVFEIALECDNRRIVSIPFVKAYFGEYDKNKKTIIILVDIKLFENNN